MNFWLLRKCEAWNIMSLKHKTRRLLRCLWLHYLGNKSLLFILISFDCREHKSNSFSKLNVFCTACYFILENLFIILYQFYLSGNITFEFQGQWFQIPWPRQYTNPNNKADNRIQDSWLVLTTAAAYEHRDNTDIIKHI